MRETSPGAGPRKANLGDAMILMIAFGIGLTLGLRALENIGQRFAMITPTGRPVLVAWVKEIAQRQGLRFLVFEGCVELLFCFVAPLTPALLVARLRRPRPAFPGLVCQPGLVASAALCLATIIEVDVAFLQLATVPFLLEAALPGAMVVASWAILALSGRWHPEASWVDRSGRLVGVFWIATIPCLACLWS